MTAIVGILNKRAAVIAADSAVTVSTGGNRKVYNTATKIFRLSLKHPVGVMIYDSSLFMNTPWDIIFKLYQDRCGDQGYDTLQGYVDNFLDFLRNEKSFFNERIEHDYLIDEVGKYYDRMIEGCKDKIANNPDADTLDVCREVINELKAEDEGLDVFSEFKDYKAKTIKMHLADIFKEWDDVREEDGYPPEIKKDLEKAFIDYLLSGPVRIGTGVVFVGYGAKDIYPSMIPVMISGIIDNRLRYRIEDPDAITNDNEAFIRPFAQSDIMITLMRGIHPYLRNEVTCAMTDALASQRETIADLLEKEGVDDALAAKVRNLDDIDIRKSFSDDLAETIHEDFVSGIVDAVEFFNVEDMANMAESLISVTNLHRHISSSEETVGGPIDVAVITRSEGFFWVKHKQWPAAQSF